MNAKTTEFNCQVQKGISWNAIQLITSKAATILIRLILTKLLLPHDFGLFAMVLMSLGIINTFADFGLQNALIQREQDNNSSLRYDSAFWFLTLTGGLWVVFVLIVVSPFLAWFYNEPRLFYIAAAMSMSIFLQNSSIIPLVILTRRMHFQYIVIAEISGTFISSIAAMIMAFTGAGYWTLVTQQLIMISLTNVFLWYYCGWFPTYRFSWHTLQDVVGYSGYMLGSRVVYYVRTNMATFFISIILGAEALGIYTLALTLTENIRTQLSSIISRVMLPAYSKLQNSPNRIRSSYLAINRAMPLMLFPVLLPMLLYADPIISFLFNDNWTRAILPVQILTVSGLFYSISGPSAEVLQGIGKPEVLFRISFINLLVVAIPLMWVMSSFFGLPGASGALVLAFIIQRFATHLAVKNSVKVSNFDLLKSITPAITGTILALLIRYGLHNCIHFLFQITLTIGIFTIITLYIYRINISKILYRK